MWAYRCDKCDKIIMGMPTDSIDIYMDKQRYYLQLGDDRTPYGIQLAQHLCPECFLLMAQAVIDKQRSK